MKHSSRTIFARNLQLLCDEIGKRPEQLGGKAGLRPRTLNSMKRHEKAARLDSVDKVAEALGVPPWLLLLPDLDKIASSKEDLFALIEAYTALPPDGRSQVWRVAEAEARYHSIGS